MGTAPLRGEAPGSGGWDGLREQRGQKDKGSARSNGAEAGMGGQSKGGCCFFCFFFLIVLLSPGYTEGKQRTAIKGL